MDLLNINDISVFYGKNPKPTIEHFSLDMKEGEVVSIVGESGSGKTTVIRAVLGLLPGGGSVRQGDILFQGNSLLKLNKTQWRNLRGSDISMIFQDSGAMINPIRRIGDQFVEYIRTHQKCRRSRSESASAARPASEQSEVAFPHMSKKDAWAKGVEMLEKMRLPDGDNIMRSYPFQLSGGMRQRVGIAMAMTFQPKLLLADEPTSALDVTTQAQIVRQFMELRDEYGTSMIVVTHNIGVAAYMADQLIVMQHGKVVDAGSRESVMSHPNDDYTRNLLAAVPELEGKRYVS
ncbi:MAG: ABC transporter ATP-binding protein [Lachnospiraceae bacterium]|nr:ABC transporter ATP-binding protein [Lachnospiraceae bacterium]